MSIGDTPLASYSYDALGRVSGINNVSFGYLANSSLLATVTRPNNVNTTWSYEANRNLVTAVENKLNNTVISNYAYTNDALGRRTAMARSGSVFTAGDTLSYSYNDRSEVTGATSNAANTTYNYAYSFDNIGNRLTANLAGTPWTYTANNLNQYSAFTINQVAETPSYDDDGNMLTRDGWTQTWNGENRLIKAEKGMTKLEFAYDYMGRRIFKKVYNGETLTSHIRFVYDGYKLIEELNALSNNAVLRRYTWSPVGLDTPISVYDANANATYYYNTDANKNITELTDATGTVVAHHEYSPFGKVLVANGTYASINPFRFSSEYHDDETALVYYNYRYYSPELGRWLSRDPIEEDGGWNLYAMVRNNTINLIDLYGLRSVKDYLMAPGNWILTDNFFPSDEELAAAYNGFMESFSCWWECEKKVHKCVAGKILTYTEIVTSPATILTARIPKSRVVAHRQPYTTIPRKIGSRLNMGKNPWHTTRSLSEEIGRSLGRSKVLITAKATFVAAIVAEAGVSVYCGALLCEKN